MKRLPLGSSFSALSVAVVLSACAAKPLTPVEAVAAKKLAPYKQACVEVTAADAKWKNQSEILTAALVDRMKDKKAFTNIAPCKGKAVAKALKVKVEITNYTGGSAALNAFTGAGAAEVNFKLDFWDGEKKIGSYLGHTDSKQKYTWAGNQFGDLEGKTMRNAAAEITILVTKNKEGEKY